MLNNGLTQLRNLCSETFVFVKALWFFCIDEGVYATGSRSGKRDPSPPNWRQVEKMQAGAVAKEQEAKKRRKAGRRRRAKANRERCAACAGDDATLPQMLIVMLVSSTLKPRSECWSL